MSVLAVLDSTPRLRRIRFVGPGGERMTFEGRVWLDGSMLRGERKDDADEEGGITLHLLRGTVSDIVWVKAEHPRYEQWVTLPWPAPSFCWDDPAIDRQLQ